MANATSSSRHVRPMLGWLSVAIAAAVFTGAVGALVPGLLDIRFQTTPSGLGVGAVAGGVAPWVVNTLVSMIVAGVVSGVVGMLRSERPRWVHVAGLSLNVIAPIAAVLTIRLFLAAVW